MPSAEELLTWLPVLKELINLGVTVIATFVLIGGSAWYVWKSEKERSALVPLLEKLSSVIDMMNETMKIVAHTGNCTNERIAVHDEKATSIFIALKTMTERMDTLHTEMATKYEVEGIKQQVIQLSSTVNGINGRI